MAKYEQVEMKADGSGFTALRTPDGITMSATWELFLIRQAWERGMDVEDLADGFGEGQGTHGDWSGIRDSTDGAVEAMTGRALNHLFTKAGIGV